MSTLANRGRSLESVVIASQAGVIRFFVPGIAAPGGSKKAFIINGRANVTESCKRNKPWRESVAVFARQAYQGEPLAGPLELDVEFRMQRPKGHYGTGRNAGTLKLGAAVFHTSKPDATKLLRALEDALTGIAWRDDSQICVQAVRKVYHATPGAVVTVKQIIWTQSCGHPLSAVVSSGEGNCGACAEVEHG